MAPIGSRACSSRRRFYGVGIVSPGFHGRPHGGGEEKRVPPGQYLTDDFPVLSAGPTPRVPTDQWEFVIATEVGRDYRWNWADLMGMPSETPTVDIHCVTKWTKLDTTWRGVSLDTMLEGVETAADYAVAVSYGGYNTHLPPPDLP